MDSLLERYFEGLDAGSVLYDAEARDFARRLRAAVDVDAGMTVLDFGCGFGRVARELAPHVARILLWDAAAVMRGHAARAVAAFDNARVVDAATIERARGEIDLVLLNSVIQYVDDGPLTGELERLATALAGGGVIVVSDVAPPGAGLVGEVLELLAFGLRQRILASVVAEQLRIVSAYRRLRRTRPLARRTPAEVEALAARAGLRTELLRENLTHRTRRFSALLRR